MTKYERNNRKLKKFEEKYCPQKYFTFQRRKLKNSLKTSIINTMSYINRNMPKYCSENIYKTYGKIDFNNKQLYGISISTATGIITGYLINFFSDISSTLNDLIQQGKDELNRFILGAISTFFMLLIALVAVIGITAAFISFQKQYYDEYNLFIAPYEREKAIKFIEKEIDNYNYKNIL